MTYKKEAGSVARIIESENQICSVLRVHTLVTEQKPNAVGFNRRGDATERMAFDVYIGGKDVKFASTKLVLIAMRVHLFPSRTQKLSSFAPTIVTG